MPGKKPNLPKTIDWPDETIAWFSAWRDSNRTDSWDQTQWQYMFDTALAHAEIWGGSNTAMLSELRARLTIMGITFDPPPKIITKKEDTPLDKAKKKRAAKAARKS